MKLYQLLSLVTMVVSIEYYDSAIDKLDMESLIKNPERMRNFTGCFIEKNQCDEMGLRVKKIIPDAMDNSCARCTPKQRQNSKKYFETLKSHHPDYYELFQKKYDPEGKLIDAMLKAVAHD